MRNIFLLCVAILGLARPVCGEIIGGHQFQVDFTKPTDAAQKATWADPQIYQATEKGLGWDGEPTSTRDGWIITQPAATGVSWRPAQFVNVQLSISPVPTEITLPNGQKSTPFSGWAFARFSADARHWSTWQALPPTQGGAAITGRSFAGTVAVPYLERLEYDKRRLDFARRQDVPWDSDEEDLARRIVQAEPDYFKNHIPFVGYVQFLFEAPFPGGLRITELKADLNFVVSGMYHEAKDPAAQKDRDGPWRFKAPDTATPTTRAAQP